MPRIELAHRWNGNEVGSTVDVDEATAKELVRYGRGRPANKTTAKAVASAMPATADNPKER